MPGEPQTQQVITIAMFYKYKHMILYNKSMPQ